MPSWIAYIGYGYCIVGGLHGLLMLIGSRLSCMSESGFWGLLWCDTGNGLLYMLQVILWPLNYLA